MKHMKEQLANTNKTIELLRARLAQPEPEPVAWFTEDHREDKSATTYSKKMAERWLEKGWPVTPLYTAPPQRNSVIDKTMAKRIATQLGWQPKREWVGLTDEEIRNEANHHVFDESFFNGAIWARGQIMGKNNG
jgi:hypothetical protein